ncbi:MAG TPA: hypothetical protein VIK07_05575 [Bacteroidales bacterium]
MSKTTAITINENILFSNLRCIKIRKTNVDLTVAIIRAIATVKVPTDICVTATEVSVRQTNPNSTKRNVL